jgi:hypothetical protein
VSKGIPMTTTARPRNLDAGEFSDSTRSKRRSVDGPPMADRDTFERL